MFSRAWFHKQSASSGLVGLGRAGLLVAGVLLWFAPLQDLTAEVIYMKNGEVIVGRVVAQTAAQMRVETRAGVRVLQKTAIQRVSYSPAEEQAALARETAAEKAAAEAEAARERRDAEARAEAARKKAEAARTDPARPGETPGPIGLTLRSAALPGLGHIALGKTYTGGAYMGLTAAAIANVFVRRSAALSAESKNNDDVNLNFALAFAPDALDVATRLGINVYLNSAAQTPYRAAIDRYDQSLLLLGVVYVWQLAHLVYDAWFAGPIASVAPPAPDPAGWRAAFRSAGDLAGGREDRGRLANSGPFVELSYVFIF